MRRALGHGPDHPVARARAPPRPAARPATLAQGSSGSWRGWGRLGDLLHPAGPVGIDFKISDGVCIQRARHAVRGDVFGKPSPFGHKRSVRVNALDDITLLSIPIDRLRGVTRECPRVGYMPRTDLAGILAEQVMLPDITPREAMGQCVPPGG